MQELLKNLVERLHSAAQTNLESVILYGSAARGDFDEAHSDLNVLCVLRSLEAGELSRIAPVVKWWSGEHRQPAPLLFSAEELRRSADVFAIEMLDMQKSHRVLYGVDAIAGIHVPMNLHRIEVEHELRTMVLRLRRHFLRVAPDKAELAAVLAKSSSSATTLCRHALVALGQEAPSAPDDVFAKIAAATGANVRGFEVARQLRGAASLERDVVLDYGAYLSALEKVVSALDHHVPKHHWQRDLNRKA